MIERIDTFDDEALEQRGRVIPSRSARSATAGELPD